MNRPAPNAATHAKPGPPVLAAKIDNAPAARPPVGIGSADQIYVEPVEGGLSRLIAVFGSHHPDVVGPVRSARETDLNLLPQYGKPTLAFSGAADALVPRIDGSSLQNASQENVPDAYQRDDSRSMPDNLFVHPDRLPQGGRWSPRAPLSFGPAPGGGKPSGHYEVQYQSASVAFDWSPQQHGWLVSMDGQPYSAADSGRLAPSTVIVQDVPIHQSTISDTAGNSSPVAQTVGHGHALVFRDGRAFEANWSRPSPDQGTRYTTPGGKPLSFAPGQVWTVLRGQ